MVTGVSLLYLGLFFMSFINRSGHKFGRLTVFDDYYIKNRKSFWKCKCECGVVKYISANSLASGMVNSCGCLRKEKAKLNKKHGLWGHPLYWVHRSMLNRCYRTKDQSYKDYGARGIKVCNKWRNSVKEFYEWCMRNGWIKGIDLDRRNNNGNYCPSNCRFVTRKVSMNNTRLSLNVTIKGKKYTMDQLEKKYGIPASRIAHRIKYNNWTVDQAISYPVGRRGEKPF